MSTGGPSSGFYQYAYFLAALVDNVLVSLKTGTEAATKHGELGRLLEALDNPHKDLQTYFVSTLLPSAADIDAAELQRLGHALVAQTTDAAAISLLERLAEVLQNEQAEAYRS